ncbi:hypothetical protein N2152v2_009215 [Parachlorella kessleri]
MEKVIAASEDDLERATQNYERFLLASEGKGRYLWNKLRDLVANMDAETKLRIKLLPVVPLDRDLAAEATVGGSASQSSSRACTPRLLTGRSTSSSKAGTPCQASKAGTPRSVSRVGSTQQLGSSSSKLGSPRSLLRAAATNAAAGPPVKVELTKRQQTTVFRWRTSMHVKLATDLPQELLRHRHDHDFDKYNASSLLAEELQQKADAGSGSRKRSSEAQPRQQQGSIDAGRQQGQAPGQQQRGASLAESQRRSSDPRRHGVQPRMTAAATHSRAASIAGSRASSTNTPTACASPRTGAAHASITADAKHYGEQWFAPPGLWAVCSAARLQDDDAVIQRLEHRNFPIDIDPAVVSAAAAAAGGNVPVPTTNTNNRSPRRSINIKEQELQEKIIDDKGAQTYAKHLEHAGKRLPAYLQSVIKPNRHVGR